MKLYSCYKHQCAMRTKYRIFATTTKLGVKIRVLSRCIGTRNNTQVSTRKRFQFHLLQIRKLERKIVASQLDPTSCVDGYGKEKKNGEKWRLHDCKTCECKVSTSCF